MKETRPTSLNKTDPENLNVMYCTQGAIGAVDTTDFGQETVKT